MSLHSGGFPITSALMVCVLVLLPVPRSAAGSNSSEVAGAILERARRVRNIDGLGDLRTRPLHLEYAYSVSRASATPGRLILELRRPGTFIRREFYPWQRLDTASTELDGTSFRRSYGKGGELEDGANAAAESNLRAVAVRDWMALLHEAPDWADLTVTRIPGADTTSADFDLLRARGARLDVRLAFDRNTGLLTRMTSPPHWRTTRETIFSAYQTFQGVLFPTRIEVRFIRPRTSTEEKFVAVLERVNF